MLMTKVVVKPMQWMHIKDLHECSPMAEDDFECMKDVRAALAKHGKLDRFALHLIHKHFDVADDEILVEYSDPQTREQFFRVEKADSPDAKQSIPTTWTLEQMEPMARCVCATRPTGHLGRHETGVSGELERELAIA
jgi:hypothetical protein